MSKSLKLYVGTGLPVRIYRGRRYDYEVEMIVVSTARDPKFKEVTRWVLSKKTRVSSRVFCEWRREVGETGLPYVIKESNFFVSTILGKKKGSSCL